LCLPVQGLGLSRSCIYAAVQCCGIDLQVCKAAVYNQRVCIAYSLHEIDLQTQ
jgi:hypothetical protein